MYVLTYVFIFKNRKMFNYIVPFYNYSFSIYDIELRSSEGTVTCILAKFKHCRGYLGL